MYPDVYNEVVAAHHKLICVRLGCPYSPPIQVLLCDTTTGAATGPPLPLEINARVLRIIWQYGPAHDYYHHAASSLLYTINCAIQVYGSCDGTTTVVL